MGEWFGTYTTGFGFARFQPCGEVDVWAVADNSLPYFNSCAKEPLWLHVIGNTTKEGNGFYISVDEIVEGPCTVGGCMESDQFEDCGNFEDLCNN